MFVFDPDRERQCFAIRSNCKRVASHLTRPHLNLASTHTNHRPGARTPHTNQGSGLACLDSPAGACPWPRALPRDPCSKQVRSNGLQTLHHISQFPSTHAPIRVALGLSVCLHMESAITTLQQLWNADSSTVWATSRCFVCLSVCPHHFLTLCGWQIPMDGTVHTLPCYATVMLLVLPPVLSPALILSRSPMWDSMAARMTTMCLAFPPYRNPHV